MDVLSREELTRLRDISQGGLHETLRRCALAVLTTGTESDDPRAAQVRYPDFDIEVLQLDRGIRLDLQNAP
ncbi:MAG: pyrimidine/purine nucleosidase domain-containing protein, partial [Arenimonas sp.]